MEEKKEKKKKDLKFLRNIIIAIVALFIVAYILNLAPGYRRNRYENVINIILNDENLTEELKKPIYVSKNGTVYISMNDVGQLLNTTIYYEEKYETLVTIMETKVGSIAKNQNQLVVNGSTLDITGTIIEANGTIYVPISDMKLVYNIDITYNSENNVVIIDELNHEMTKATVTKDSIIKYKARSLSKDVAEIKAGEVVSTFYTTKRGWTEIRTDSGLLGYIKEDALANQYEIRQNMDKKIIAKEILLNSNKFSIVENENVTNVRIENIFKISQEGLLGIVELEETDDEIWAIISNENFENISNKVLEDYNARTEMIDIIVNLAIKNKLSGIAIKTNQIDEYSSFKKFMFELSPRLRELGINVALYKTSEIKGKDFKNIVDYILVEEGK